MRHSTRRAVEATLVEHTVLPGGKSAAAMVVRLVKGVIVLDEEEQILMRWRMWPALRLEADRCSLACWAGDGQTWTVFVVTGGDAGPRLCRGCGLSSSRGQKGSKLG